MDLRKMLSYYVTFALFPLNILVTKTLLVYLTDRDHNKVDSLSCFLEFL